MKDSFHPRLIYMRCSCKIQSIVRKLELYCVNNGGLCYDAAKSFWVMCLKCIKAPHSRDFLWRIQRKIIASAAKVYTFTSSPSPLRNCNSCKFLSAHLICLMHLPYLLSGGAGAGSKKRSSLFQSQMPPSAAVFTANYKRHAPQSFVIKANK
jgi:hypothetical protein